jgi:D-alanine-D-alanine ligase
MKILIAVANEDTTRSDVTDALRCANAVAGGLAEGKHAVAILQVDEQALAAAEALRSRILAARPDCVFNLFEGFSRNAQCEADFADILDSLRVPYTGNSARTLRLCLNKETTKKILREHQVPVPDGICLNSGDALEGVLLRFPLFIKPCCEDASVGIDADSLVADGHSLRAAVTAKLRQFPGGVIVESFLSGTEYNVGCVGCSPYEVLGVSSMEYTAQGDMLPFLTYSAKWQTETPEYRALTPSPESPVAPELRDKIVAVAVRAGQALGCRGYFRVDMREHNGGLFVIDVNPNPDINTDSGFMRQAYHRGHAYNDVLDKIIKTAITSMD